MARAPRTRRVQCPRCETGIEVSTNARSILCSGCHQSLPTEDEKVKEYCARREFFSEGTITVTKKGTLIANVRVRSLTIQGEVKGPVRSREAIHVGKTGRLYGDFTAPLLRVEAGAKIIGKCAFGPKAEILQEKNISVPA